MTHRMRTRIADSNRASTVTTNSPVVPVQQELSMLSASQDIYIQRIRLVVQNGGNLFDAQYRALAFRLLINIDRDVVTTSAGDS